MSARFIGRNLVWYGLVFLQFLVLVALFLREFWIFVEIPNQIFDSVMYIIIAILSAVKYQETLYIRKFPSMTLVLHHQIIES